MSEIIYKVNGNLYILAKPTSDEPALKATEPETTEPETTKPETTEPEPKAAEPETAEPEPKAAEPEPKSAEPELKVSEDKIKTKNHFAYDEEIDAEINSVPEMDIDELNKINKEAAAFYLKNIDSSVIPLNAVKFDINSYTGIKNFDYMQLMDKYSLIANFYQNVKNDGPTAKKFYLLAIRHGSSIAMYNYGRLFYHYHDFDKAKKYYIMSLHFGTDIIIDKYNMVEYLKILFKMNKKPVDEYLSALDECKNMYRVRHEIARVKRTINSSY